MMTCIAAVLMLVVSLSLYLYVSGVFNTFDPGAFRFALYILLFFIFALTVWVGLIQHPYEGYDPTEDTR